MKVVTYNIQYGLGKDVRIYSVQLSHLSPDTRMPQVEALLDIMRERRPKAAHGAAAIRTSRSRSVRSFRFTQAYVDPHSGA